MSATLSASRKSSCGNTMSSSPRPSISGTLHNNLNSHTNDTRMTIVNEEEDDSSNQLSPNDKLKNPRSCNERSDSGFSECSNCSTPSSSCLCNLTLLEKNQSIIEEQPSISSTENEESTGSAHPRTDDKTTADDSFALSCFKHDIRSEISSLEYDEANKSTYDDSQNIVVSLKVPTRRELYQDEQEDLLSEVERRKVSLENTTKVSSFKHEATKDKMKRSKVALLMEKFESSRYNSSLPSSKIKPVVTSGDLSKGLNSNSANIKAFDCVEMFDVEKNSGSDGFNSFSSDFQFTAKPKPATRNSTNSTTFRLSNRVREVTERLSRPKQYAEETTKSSILKQDSGTISRSREFWKR